MKRMKHNKPLYILAGNYAQAHNYVVEHNLKQGEWFYIGTKERILGIRNGRFVKIGTYYERKDYREIISYLKYANFKEERNRDGYEEASK